MVIVLTGGTGLVGQALGKKLSENNYKIHLLARKPPAKQPYPCQVFLWPDVSANLPYEAFPKDEKYGVIHLVGEPVSQWPWTKSRKNKIYSSRVEGTKNLVSTLKKQSRLPQFFLSVSAVGIYADQKSYHLTELSPTPDQNFFLQKVCKAWEKSALSMSSSTRTLVFRLGIVMSSQKGFLYEQIKWLKRGLCPRIISQKANWMSWISIEDLTSLMLWALENPKAEGVYNAVSPQAIDLKDFYNVLAKELNFKGLRMPLPLFFMKNIGGEMTQNLLASAKAFPEKALAEGFHFKQEELKSVFK